MHWIRGFEKYFPMQNDYWHNWHINNKCIYLMNHDVNFLLNWQFIFTSLIIINKTDTQCTDFRCVQRLRSIRFKWTIVDSFFYFGRWCSASKAATQTRTHLKILFVFFLLTFGKYMDSIEFRVCDTHYVMSQCCWLLSIPNRPKFTNSEPIPEVR